MTIKVINGIPTNVGSTDDKFGITFSGNKNAPGNVVTGLNFSNSIAFKLQAHIRLESDVDKNEYVVMTATRQSTDPSATWDLSYNRVGDNTGVNFSVDSSDNVRYSSTDYSGFVSLTFIFNAQALG